MALPQSVGRMGLPARLQSVCMEFWTSACMAFSFGPVLTLGTTEAIELHASEELKALWLPKLVSSEWMGAMDLTEPQAGSDLAAIRTAAFPQDDGTYLIKGEKCFITCGEHDLTENIVHLVLGCPMRPQVRAASSCSWFRNAYAMRGHAAYTDR